MLKIYNSIFAAQALFLSKNRVALSESLSLLKKKKKMRRGSVCM